MLRAIITHDGHARILKDVPPWKIFAGNPARFIKKRILVENF